MSAPAGAVLAVASRASWVGGGGSAVYRARRGPWFREVNSHRQTLQCGRVNFATWSLSDYDLVRLNVGSVLRVRSGLGFNGPQVDADCYGEQRFDIADQRLFGGVGETLESPRHRSVCRVCADGCRRVSIGGVRS